ncbi:hypothetical protein NECAME_19056, partial [Necator americanus]
LLSNLTSIQRSHVRLEWIRVGYPSLPPSADFTIYGNTTMLYLKGVSEEDEGQYRCMATTVNAIAADDATLTISSSASQSSCLLTLLITTLVPKTIYS